MPSFSEFARLVSAFVRSHCTVCIVATQLQLGWGVRLYYGIHEDEHVGLGRRSQEGTAPGRQQFDYRNRATMYKLEKDGV